MNTEEMINVITLLDEEGKEVAFDHLLTFKHLEHKYIALMAMDDVEGMTSDEVMILEIISKNGEDSYVSIGNQVLLEEVFDTFLDLFDEYIDEIDEES